MTAVAYVAASALFTTGGVLLLRNALAGADLSVATVRGLLTDATFLTGFVLYALSFLTWLLALSRFEAARIFPAFVSAGYVGVLLGGHFLLGESLGVTRIAGIAVILVGIALVVR